jgi:Uma2 family endonuclease
MVLTPERIVTLEEFLTMPETKPASEYLNGQIIRKPMPKGKHSTIQGELVTTINAVVKRRRIACAFPELRCIFGGRSIVPDISVFAWDRISFDENGDIANAFPIYPDWTIEILSPDRNPSKVTSNILHCLNYGCQMGWLIDPAEKLIFIYPAGQQPELLQEEQDILRIPNLFSGLQLTLGDVFGWLKL